MTEALFIESVYKSKLHDMYQLLKSTKVNIYESKDTHGMTAFHIASLNGGISVIKFLVEFAKSNKQFAELRDLCNKQSDEGFLPIHFSAFRGHLVYDI
jgi:Ankyrin repeats (many copies)